MAYPKLTDEAGALELAAQIRAGALSPLEAVEAAIARIEAGDGEINAVVVRDFDRARATAKALDGQTPGKDQPLFGVPMTIKESFDVAGLPTTFGCSDHANHRAASDSLVTRQIRATGAILIGKTNVPPDLSDWQSNNPVYGRTNNPHDLSRTPGGSSGGSAAAVAAGFVPCEYGGDIGGSIRAPAHFCGVWGHKSSFGLTSRRGHQSPGIPELLHNNALSVRGPFARNAEDLAVLMKATALLPLESRVKPIRECRMLALLEHPVSTLDSGVMDPLQQAMQTLRQAGVAVDETADILPDLAEQNRNFLRMLNISNSRGAPSPSGKQTSAAEWFELLNKQAQNEVAWEALFESYDFVLAPAAQVLAPHHVEGELFKTTVMVNGREERASLGLAWSGLATFPNLPATVLPAGGSNGLPCGMQVIGPFWRDLDCIAAAGEIATILHG